MNIFNRFKSGPLHRWKIYWHHLGNDYKSVVFESLAFIRESPIKATGYLTGCWTFVFAWRTAPDLRHFQYQLQESAGRLQLLAPGQRRQHSCHHVHRLIGLYGQERLQAFHVGLFSVLIRLPSSHQLSLPSATCKQLRAWPWQLPGQVEDVGVFGVWWNLRWNMMDYDVSEQLTDY